MLKTTLQHRRRNAGRLCNLPMTSPDTQCRPCVHFIYFNKNNLTELYMDARLSLISEKSRRIAMVKTTKPSRDSII